MNDPHVNALLYRVITTEDVDYDKAPPLSGETDNFIFTIAGDTASFSMKSHFATEEEAKKVVDEFLKAWSISIGLECTPDEIVFRFESAEIIDRHPQKQIVELTPHPLSLTLDILPCTIHISKSKFPPPPENFVASPDVETMYSRYRIYRQNRETLLPMAYWFLTMIEASAGGRKDTAKKYCIDLKVLSKLGELSSERGHTVEARKVPKKGALTPLTPNEKRWIEEVIKRIIFRVGEHAFDPQLKLQKITMNDFPNLDKK